jgi:hypothetical protein
MKGLPVVLLVLTGCATHVVHQTRVVHVRTHTVVHSVPRVRRVPYAVMTPAEVRVYDIGRMTDGHGGMIEAHREYRIVRDAEFNLNAHGHAIAPAVEPAQSPTPPEPARVTTEDDTKAKLAEIAKQTDESLRKLQLDPSAAPTPSPAVDPLIQFGRANQ